MGKIFQFLVAIVLTIVVIIPSNADEATNNILTRVFLIKYREKFGASFTIEVENKQYLITAKHNVEGIKDGDNVEIMHNKEWKPFSVKALYVEPPEVDIVVLVLPVQISPTFPIKPSSDGLILSQNMFFLGFPFGLRMEYENLNIGFPLPIVKSGICSAMIQPGGGYQIILVDGINNPGFSGGPLVYVNRSSRQLMIAGVIKGFRHQEEPVFKKIRSHAKNKLSGDYELVETDFVVKSNTGIVIAYDIGSAVNIIKKNPIGPVVKK